ncbi:MAG: ribonuclease catalytic domain-containing protein [Thermodesulfobacteriota bacterium]
MTSPGTIVEYLDGGKFVCARVTESHAKRLRIINQNGREVNLPLSRVVHFSTRPLLSSVSREDTLRTLKETSQKRESLVGQINLEEIWELTSEANDSSFTPTFLSELNFGEEASDDLVSALLRSVFLDRLYFKYKEGKVHVNSPAQVEQLKIQQEKEQKREELIQFGAENLRRIQSGAYDDTELDNDCRSCLEIISDFYLFGNDAKHSDIARQILKIAGLGRPHDPFQLLVKAGIWGENENIPLLRQELPVDFSLEARQLAENILQQGTGNLRDDSGRIDLTHLKPMTIDGASTLDYDDALTIEAKGDDLLLGVHISDVAFYVKPGDPLFLEATHRCTSLYFPEGQVPMLPRHLSQGICSLIQGEERAAMSFLILLSKEAEVKQVRIKPSIIKVARRLTYDEVDQLITKKDDWEISTLNDLRIKFRNRRLEAGALLLPFPDVNIHVNGNSVQAHLSDTDTPARTLVSETMILTNQEAARYIADRMVPGLFRAQGPPRKRVVHGIDNDLFLNSRQRKMLSRGELLTQAKTHSGLGVEQYTTVTSPIRRLLDLLMQHQLHSIIRHQPAAFSEEDCKDFSALLTRNLARANSVKQQRHRYWLLKYLEARRGLQLEALVIDSGPKRISMLLTDILMDIDLPTPHGSKPVPGSTTLVTVAKADPLENSVRFEW